MVSKNRICFDQLNQSIPSWPTLCQSDAQLFIAVIYLNRQNELCVDLGLVHKTDFQTLLLRDYKTCILSINI